ncbi:MAG: hypothetical protein J7647_13560 [Cyanobacteria bacterium SBLK]|nr:hypothetical protein [Cyanobacteria bacterium SBLK]
MKTSLHFMDTVDMGLVARLAIGVSLQLSLFVACEAVAQTHAQAQSKNSSVRPIESLKTESLQKVDANSELARLYIYQGFTSPDRDKPGTDGSGTGTQGSGTR